MRLVLACLLIFSGCRLGGVPAARREVVSDALQTLRFPFAPEDAALRLRGQLASTRCCGNRHLKFSPHCQRG